MGSSEFIANTHQLGPHQRRRSAGELWRADTVWHCVCENIETCIVYIYAKTLNTDYKILISSTDAPNVTKQEPLPVHKNSSQHSVLVKHFKLPFFMEATCQLVSHRHYITLSHSQDIYKRCKLLSGFGLTNYIRED